MTAMTKLRPTIGTISKSPAAQTVVRCLIECAVLGLSSRLAARSTVRCDHRCE